MRFNKVYLFCILLPFYTLIFHSAHGQNNFWGETETEIKFKHLTTKQGLSSNVTSSILKDRKGFLWIGTDAGLNKFDGFEITTFNYSPNQKNSLSNSVVRCLYEDSKGLIWIGTDKGLNVYDPSDQSIKYFLSEANNPRSLSNNTISSITEDAKGNLWIGTFFGLNKMTGWYEAAPIFESFYSTSGDSTSLKNNRIFCLYSDSKDNLWIGTEGDGLYFLSKEDKNSQHFNFQQIVSTRTDNSELSESIIFCINELKNGSIYIGTNQGFSIINETEKGLNIKHNLPKKNTNDWFSEDRVYSIVADKIGRIWIGTFGDGLFQYNENNNTFRKYEHSVYDNQSISRNHIFSMFADEDDFVWIVARETGIDHIDPQIQNFIHLRSVPNNKNSLSSNIIKSISEDKEGKFWFGTYGGGLNMYDPSIGQYFSFNHDPQNSNTISSHIIETTCIDYIGRLWIGTPKGLNMFNPADKTFKTFKNNPSNPNSIVDASIWFILPAKDNSGLWIATYNGLDKYDWKENKFYHYKNKPGVSTSLSFNNIRALFEDSKRNLWIGTWGGGLDKLEDTKNINPDSTKFMHYKYSQTEENCVSSDLVNTIFEDSKGNLWIGTQEGLNKFSTGNNSFVNFSVADGLADNIVKGILEDNNGFIWISTQKGLSRLNPDNYEFNNFFQEDGLQGNIFNLSSCIKTSQGELMFGGNTGVSIFNPEKINTKSDFPKAYIKSIQINNNKINPGDILNKRILFKNVLNETTKIELHHNENLVGLTFSAIEYSYPERINFAYKLQGIDKDWNTTSYKNREVTYVGLKTGKYRFLVKASNIYGEWPDDVKTISLQIYPPWYKTNLAYFLYVLLFVLTTYFIGKLILVRVKIKRELVQEKTERKRQAELDNFKLQFFTNISHEIRTPLTLISGPLQKLITRNSKMPNEQIDAQLSVMNRSVSILTKLVNQLLDFRKAEKGRIKLRIRYFDLYKQLKRHFDDFNDYATDKNLRLDFKSSFNSMNFWYDIDIIEKIFFNIMSNAVKYTPAGEKICVSLKNTGEIELPENVDKNKDDYFCFIIEDTGIGISKENQKFIFDRFYQIDTDDNNKVGTGIGLSYTKVLVERHRGFIDLQSEHGMGSKFTVWLPATKRFYDPSQIITDSINEVSHFKEDHIFTPLAVENSETAKNELTDETKDITILIVEDNKELQSFLQAIFIKKYNVSLAANGQEGIVKAERENPDVIITDVMMPVMNGLQLTKSIKKNLNTSHIPIIMLTAKNTIDNEIQGLKTGADYYLSKPFNIEQLELIVKNIIDSRKKMHQMYSGFQMPKPKEIKVLSLDEKFMIKVGELIEEMMDDSDLSVELMAKKNHISTVNLYRKIKALTGMSPNEYIRAFRLDRASQLLAQNKLKVSEVAYNVGFNDPKYFGKCFKKAFGVSPSEYGKMKEL